MKPKNRFPISGFALLFILLFTPTIVIAQPPDPKCTCAYCGYPCGTGHASNCRYNSSISSNNGVTQVETNEGEWWIINRQGKQLNAEKFDDYIGNFFEGLAVVKQQGKYGYINELGIIVIPCKYENAEPFFEGLAAVEMNKKYGFINQSGTLVIPLKFEGVLLFNEGLAPVFMMGQ